MSLKKNIFSRILSKINYIMVEGKFFENEWVLAYLSGWFEAYSRATKLKENIGQRQ